MSWLRLFVLTILIFPHLVETAYAEVSPKWTSIIKDANRVFGFQIPVYLLRGADGTLHTVVWSRTLPSEPTYKSGYVYRPISSAGVLGSAKVVGETTESLTYFPGIVEEADGSVRIYYYSTDSDPRILKRAISDVARKAWSVENVPSVSAANFRSGIVVYRNSTGDILHTMSENSEETRKFVVITPGQEPVTAISAATVSGAFWLGAFSQSGGDADLAYFLKLDQNNKNKASIGFLQTVPTIGAVTNNVQGASNLGKGYEDSPYAFGSLLPAAHRIGATGDLLAYPVTARGKVTYPKFNLWKSDTATAVLAGTAKEAIRGIALAPTPGGGVFIAFYTDSNIFFRQSSADLSKLGRIVKVTGPRLDTKGGSVFLSQLQADGATGALDLFSAVSDRYSIEYGYTRLLPIIEYKVTPKTVKKKGTSSVAFTLTNIEGAPLVGAKVELSGTKTKVLTDATGLATISTAALKNRGSKVQFKVSATGYQTETISLGVK